MNPENSNEPVSPSPEQHSSSHPEAQREEVKSQEATSSTAEQERSSQPDTPRSEKSQELQISLTIRTDTTDVSLTLTGDTQQPNVVLDTSVHKVQESSQAALPSAEQDHSSQLEARRQEVKSQEATSSTAKQDRSTEQDASGKKKSQEQPLPPSSEQDSTAENGSGKEKSQQSKPPSAEQDRNAEQNGNGFKKSQEESAPPTAKQNGSGKKKSQEESAPASAEQDRNVEQNGDDSKKSQEESAPPTAEQNGSGDSPTPQVNRKELYKRAVKEAFVKLNPKHQVKNPVMFFVWVGTIITALLTIDPNLFGPVKGENLKLFNGLITIILFFTVLFSNFAEAVAEGRGKSQADALRATKTETTARKVMPNGEIEEVPSTELKKDDRIKVVAGDTIPADGEVIEGTASVDESAVTGESAPVTKEPGSDVASSVTGGTTIVSDELTIRVTSDPGQGFVDKMINLVEGADRSKTPNEIALTVLLAILTLVFLCVVTTIPLFAIYTKSQISVAILVSLLVALIPTTIGGLLNAIGIAGMDRVAQFNVIATSGRAVEACGDINTLILDKTGTITKGNRLADEFIPINGHSKEELAKVALAASVFDQTPEGKSIVELAQKSGASVDFDRNAAEAIEFSAKTKMSGTRLPNGGEARKGAVKAVENFAQSGNEQANSELDAAHKQVSEQGGTPLAVCQDKEIYGVINLKDIIKPGIRDRFDQLRKMGVRTLMLTGDNQLTAAAIALEAGVDDFIAEAKPEDKIEVIKQEKAQGKVVAMTGDGTNDAPALAQADVGLAMNSGTQAAKEAANMVDLDSDPTKLIEIVAIGKQLLITRGALTTFSLANDISKYFAIIPVMFPTVGIDALNIMGLASIKSAVLSALIYNALIIPALIPLALKGVKFRPLKANDLLKRNIWIYGLGGVIAPFIAIKLISIAIEVVGFK